MWAGEQDGNRPALWVSWLPPANDIRPNFPILQTRRTQTGTEILSVKKYKRAKTLGTRFLAVALPSVHGPPVLTSKKKRKKHI